jgi:raffinose/stachyose/melibiose transport system substrate-binding protein
MKKFLAIVLALTMVIALAACGVSTESAAPAASSGDSQAAAPAASKNGIILFNGKIEIDTALQHATQVYEAATGKHVEINSVGGGVDLQSELKQRYQAGKMPDIYTCEGTPDFSNWTGMMVDLADQPWAADTEAEFIDSTGATVGFPYTTEAIGLAYNKDLLDKAGIDPASITGPESMKAAFAKLDSMKDELGITAVVGWCANAKELYWSTGNHMFCNYLDAGLARNDSTYFDLMMNEGKLDLDRFTPFAEMVGLFNQYSDPALLVSGTYDQQVQGFASGKYAFVTQGSWIGASMTSAYASDYEAAGKFECGYVPYAFIEGIDTILTNAPSHWAVYKDGNVAEAEEFLNWLAGPDGQQIMVQEAGCVSPFKSCTVVANDPFAGPITEYASAGKTSAWHWMGQPSNMAQEGTGVVFQQFAMGNLDVQGFVDTMAKVIPNYCG